MDKTAIDTLLEAGVLAPSGDNLQPWKFTFDRASRSILLDVDPKRDTSPMNAGQRMSRISLGAVLENVVRTGSATDRLLLGKVPISNCMLTFGIQRSIRKEQRKK